MAKLETALAAKVAASKVDQAEIDRRLAFAESNIADAAAGFTDWVTDDIVRAHGELERLENGSGDCSSVREIFRVAHDIKGQGTTFGFPLITTISVPFCDFLRNATTIPSPRQVNVIRAHLTAYRTIVDNDIRGDGGEEGRRLVEILAAAIAGVPALG